MAFQTFGRLARKDDDRREDVYAHFETGRTALMSQSPRNKNFGASVLVGDVSYDGLWVTFGNDNNVWLRDLARSATRLVWHEDNDPAQPFPAGSVGRPVLSANAVFAAFTTMSTEIVKGEKRHFSDVFRSTSPPARSGGSWWRPTVGSVTTTASSRACPRPAATSASRPSRTTSCPVTLPAATCSSGT